MKHVSSLLLALVLSVSITSCGKKQNKPAQAEQKKTEAGKTTTPPVIVVAPPPVNKDGSTTERIKLGDLSEIDSGSAMANYLDNFLGISHSQFMSANCFRRMQFKFKDGSTLDALEIYNESCSKVDVKNPKAGQLQARLWAGPHNRLLAPAQEENENEILVGSLMEVGMYPGPNLFKLGDLCSNQERDEHIDQKYVVARTWNVCKYTVDKASGKLESGSFKMQMRNNL